MSENVYVRGSSDSSFEAMTKEQIYAAIVEAVQGGTVGDIDTGFVTTIKEQNKGQGLMFWVGTTAEYEALAEKPNNVLYIKTDDTSAQDISNNFTSISNQLTTINQNIAKQERVEIYNWYDDTTSDQSTAPFILTLSQSVLNFDEIEIWCTSDASTSTMQGIVTKMVIPQDDSWSTISGEVTTQNSEISGTNKYFLTQAFLSIQKSQPTKVTSTLLRNITFTEGAGFAIDYDVSENNDLRIMRIVGVGNRGA